MREGIFRKGLVCAIVILFIGTSIVSAFNVNPANKSKPMNRGWLYVGGSGPGNYTSIQDAIDDAVDGDTVFVYNGTYYEAVDVDKSINLIGEERDITEIINECEDYFAVDISADLVNISGFTIITNCGFERYDIGLISIGSCNNNVSNNILIGGSLGTNGIELSGSSNNNTIIGNIILDNGWGIYLSSSSNNIIENNNLSNNLYDIILEENCMNNTITGNTLLNTLWCYSIGIHFSSNNTIIDNTFSRVGDCACIELYSSNKNIVMNNTMISVPYDGIGDGISIENSKENIIIGNTIKNLKWQWQSGISLRSATDNTITSNNLICCSTGISSYGKDTSNDNTIHHNNFFNNTQNAYDECSNEWDNGYPSGGNYWDDYNGTDADGDGIGDTPYPIPGGDNEDRYPLIEPWEDNLIPIAKFTWTPALPEPNETILFNASESVDYDGNITLYEWDWNNDGEYDENHTSPTATHTFEEIGYYPVTLKVTDNASLTGIKTKTVRVGNQPPYEPSKPYPEDGTEYVPLNLILSWTGGDPDPDDTVTYDVYFEKDDPTPHLVSNNQTGTTYNPGNLELYKTYYWRIVAWDNHGASTAGPVWHFSTNVTPVPPPPTIDGPRRGKVGIEYEYTFSVKDNGCNNVSIYIVWGDGETNRTAFVEPGIEIKLNHTWYKKGNYIIMANAKDIYGLEGEWGTLSVTMPLNLQSSQQSSNQLLLKLMQRVLLNMR